MIKKFGYVFTVIAVAFASVHLAALTAFAAESKPTILTSLEVTQALAESLTKGTSFRVVNVVPARYSMRGQDVYFKKHQKAFFKRAEEADAVLTVGEAWPGDPLYKWARRGNIRIVNIDAVKPLDLYGAGVPLVEVEGRYSPFVWNSPANLTRMATIVAADISRLVPADTQRITANLNALQTALFRLRSEYESAFLELDSVDLAALTVDYAPLMNEFGLNVGFHMLKPESEWTKQDAVRFSARLKGEEIKAVICPWEPDAKAKTAIVDGGAVPVVMQRFHRKGTADPVDALVDWYKGNLSRLITVLKQ